MNSTDLEEMMSNIQDEIRDMKDCFLRPEGSITESACTAGLEESVQRVLDWVKNGTGMEEQPGFSEPVDKMAILITGGDVTNQAAEVFLPWLNTTCELPSLPDRRYGHVQSGNTLCGEGEWCSSTWRSCLQWRQGGWATLPVTLAEERYYSSVWGTEEGLVIMGGYIGAGQTSETVASDWANTVTSFRMAHPTR